MRTRYKAERLRLFAQLLCVVLLLALLASMLITEGLRADAAVSYERAKMASYTYTDALSGYIFRDESALESNNNGPIEYAVENGAAVDSSTVVAHVYIDDTDTDKRERAAAIYEEIAELQAALDAAGTHWQASYVTEYAALMRALGAKDLPQATESADALATVLTGRDATDPSTLSAIETRIAALREELALLVRHVDAPQSVSGSAEGFFYREADGYEALFGTQVAPTLTPKLLNTLLEDPQDSPSIIGKVIGRGAWYLALPVSVSLAETYTVGEAYTVHFDSSATTLPLRLCAINPDADSDLALLILRGEEYPTALGNIRRHAVRIEKQTVTGLRIPAAALQEDHSVFVEENGVARLRYVTPILDTEGCLLISPTGEGTDALREGEHVLVSARRIYDGKVLS